MSLFSTITVCTDFSPGASAAVERAAQIAAEHGSSLFLLHVSAPSSAAPREDILASTSVDAESEAGKMRVRLSQLAGELAQRYGVKVDSDVKIGMAFVEIVAHIQADMPSLVVVGSQFDPSMAGLGSTALKLLRSPECPVLVVRNSNTKPYQKVMSGVDLRDGSVRAAVTALALFPSAHHNLLYAVAPSLDSSLETGGLDAVEIQALHEARYQHAELELRLLAQGLSKKATHRVAAQVANDVPSRALMVGVATLEADCVAVGHHDDNTIGQAEIGSIASHVVQFIPGDVLVVP